jgi:hypothetical protein
MLALALFSYHVLDKNQATGNALQKVIDVELQPFVMIQLATLFSKAYIVN